MKGSGKSTLLNYLHSDPRTYAALRRWADRKQLIIATFFFWNSGTPLQKNHLGLLRSLIFQILEQCPELTPLALPSEEEVTRIQDLSPADASTIWTVRRLAAMLMKLLAEGPFFANIRICLFIDGLDEFEGEHDELATLLKDATVECEQDLKICTSSRPWIVFEEAFDGLASLRLQDLTHRDIEIYIEDRIHAHPRIQRLRIEEPSTVTALTQAIAKKADGVFLWVC